MKLLVVYYSRDGATRTVAEKLGEDLGCQVEEITDLRNRKGIIGWLYCGRDAFRKNLTEIRDIPLDLSSYDMIIIGTPVWAGKMAPAVRTFLTLHKDRIKKLSVFITKSTTNIKTIADDIRNVSGLPPVRGLDLKSTEIKDMSYRQKVKEFASEIIHH